MHWPCLDALAQGREPRGGEVLEQRGREEGLDTMELQDCGYMYSQVVTAHSSSENNTTQKDLSHIRNR